MLTIPLISTPTSESCAGRFQNPGNLDVLQFLNAQGGVHMHINANGSIDPPLYPQTAIGTITSAQLLTLHVTPPVLLASAGPNTIIVPFFVTLIYNFNGTPYSISGGFEVLYVAWANPTAAVIQFADTGFLDQSSSQITYNTTSQPTLPLTSALGQPVVLASLDTYTLGNGTLDFIMTYSVVAYS